MKRQIIATLLQANRADLANHIAYSSVVRKRKGRPSDSPDQPPDVVFDHDLPDVQMFWYGPGAEAEGLYVSVDGTDYEWWWWGIDVNKAEKVANQVADLLADYRAGETESFELNREAQKLGAR